MTKLIFQLLIHIHGSIVPMCKNTYIHTHTRLWPLALASPNALTSNLANYHSKQRKKNTFIRLYIYIYPRNIQVVATWAVKALKEQGHPIYEEVNAEAHGSWTKFHIWDEWGAFAYSAFSAKSTVHHWKLKLPSFLYIFVMFKTILHSWAHVDLLIDMLKNEESCVELQI